MVPFSAEKASFRGKTPEKALTDKPLSPLCPRLILPDLFYSPTRTISMRNVAVDEKDFRKVIPVPQTKPSGHTMAGHRSQYP